MQTAIAKWGNSLALRLPRTVVSDARLSAGTLVEIKIEGDTVIVTKVRSRPKLQDLLARMKPEHRHAEVDWGKPQGREVW